MFGGRRVTSRLLAVFVFVSVIFIYFLINNSNTTVKNADFINSRIAKKSYPKKSQVDLVVVEEHHEVLEYWFDAANKGIIPKSGNVLLHIDAHSDMAPPEMVDDYPVFRWPKDNREVKAMMQSNDVFIQAAVMSGLFKKVIWVWPSWDEDTHDGDDISLKYGGGVTTFDIPDNEQHFCECQYSKDGKTKQECQFVNRTMFSEDEDYDGSDIKPKDCDIKGNIVYQQIVDYNALNKLTLGQLVGEGESLLLDIDEDFFGCVLRGHHLVDAGIPWDTVEEIDDLTSEVFCPGLTAHEGIANRFMQVILALIIKHCKSSEEASVACVTPRNPTSKALSIDINRVVKNYLGKGIFCAMSRSIRQQRLEKLIEYFLDLTVPQIRACADLGFCMQTSPRSYQANGFQLCHGANEPNTTIVTQHSPGENELILRLRRVRRMLRTQSYPTPGMVTLCRSVRDGYTSVKYFDDIEESVIESVLNSRKDVTFNVIYDINLLGGEKGWPSRRMRKTTKNVKQ